MALQQPYHYLTIPSNRNRIYLTQSSGDKKGRGTQYSPAEQFAPLTSTFQQQLVIGIGSASFVAIGANFGGITSFLFGLSPDTGRNLKLDVLYPIGGYSRCIQPDEGFTTWVADQTLFYRAAERAEQESSLDPPPLNSDKRSKRNVNESVIAFGPPGSAGEFNVSVIVSSVSPDLRCEGYIAEIKPERRFSEKRKLL
ncbi:psbP domain-containing protein 7, chloroplastic-like [Chenopodium quinoa]|uniref:psbP domain-containing protein 7, chloroplastic-like n=1 Tax=Chenopodium quinoa TaxID=63459 RepID=UPI000B7746C2|nr:psbP domain-containing protein 7, chloroplastic-like [Chenopodium quinoa]